jgi:polyisoprenoid-binding protein YceI
MTAPGQAAAAALEALVREGKLTGEWALDPSASRIELASKSIWGLVPVKGSFGQFSGSGTVSATGEASGTITVAAASIDTKTGKRDNHLRSKDFFDAEHFPSMVFSADSIRPAGAGVTVTGSLTVRDHTEPLSFDAEVSVPEDGQVTLDAVVRINRADFGLTFNQLGMMSMHNTITIHAVFTRPSPPAQGQPAEGQPAEG